MTSEFLDQDGWRSALRWAGAALTVAAAHVAGAWFIAQHRSETPAGADAPAIMIDLAPRATAPAEEPTDLAPAEETAEVQPDPVEEPDRDTVQNEPLPEPDLPPPPEPVEPALHDIQPQPIKQAEVTLPMPPPPARKPPEREAEKPERKRPEPKRPEPKPRTPRPIQEKRQAQAQSQVTTAPPRAQQFAPSPAATAPPQGVPAPSAAMTASWVSRLNAHLNRSKRYPPEARARREEGIVRLSFSIDPSGRVLSYRIVGSSGSSLLDQEALALIQRASPVPAPPAGAALSFTVPIRFNVN
jgi:protein TonB